MVSIKFVIYTLEKFEFCYFCFFIFVLYMKEWKYTSHKRSIRCKGKSSFRITFVWNTIIFCIIIRKHCWFRKYYVQKHIRTVLYYINIYVNCNMLSSGYRKINPLQPKSECCIWLLLFTQNPHSSIEIEWKIKL